MLENKEVSRNRLKEFGCFNMERREQSVRGFGGKKKKIITRKKNGQLFSISMEDYSTMVVMNTKAFPHWTLEQTTEEDSSIPIT